MDDFINAFNTKIDQLSEANKEITNKLRQNQDFNGEVLKGLTDIDSLVKKINNKILNVKRRIYFLTNEASANSEQLSISQQESATLSQLVELIKSQRENITQNALPGNEAKQQELQNKIAELEDKITEYEKDKGLNSVEKAQLENQIKKLNFEKKKLEDANNEFNKLKSDKDATAAERDEAKKQIVELQKQIEQTKNEIKKRENELSYVQNAHQNAEDYIDNKGYDNKSEIAQLQDEYHTNLDELENVKRDLASAQDQQQRFQQEAQEKQKQYDELYKLHSENVKKITQLEQNQVRLQQIISRAQNVIDETLQNIQALNNGDSNFEDIRNLLKGVLEQLQNMDKGIGDPSPNVPQESQPAQSQSQPQSPSSSSIQPPTPMPTNNEDTEDVSQGSSNQGFFSDIDWSGLSNKDLEGLGTKHRGGKTRKRKQKKRPKKTKNMKKQKGGYIYGSLKKIHSKYRKSTRGRSSSRRTRL